MADHGGQKDLQNQVIAVVLKVYKEKMDFALSLKHYLPTELEQLHKKLCENVLSTVTDSFDKNSDHFQWLTRALGLHYEMYGHRNRVKLTVLHEHDEKLMRESVAEVFVKVFHANKRRYAKAVCFEHLSYQDAFQELKSTALDAAVKHYLRLSNFPEHNIEQLTDERFAEFNGQFREACVAVEEGAKSDAVEVIGGGIRRRNAVVRKGQLRPRSSGSISDLTKLSLSLSHSIATTDDSGYIDTADQVALLSDCDDSNGSSRASPCGDQIYALSPQEENQLRSQLQKLVNSYEDGTVVDDCDAHLFDTKGTGRRSARPSTRPRRFLGDQKRSISTSELPVAACSLRPGGNQEIDNRKIAMESFEFFKCTHRSSDESWESSDSAGSSVTKARSSDDLSMMSSRPVPKPRMQLKRQSCIEVSEESPYHSQDEDLVGTDEANNNGHDAMDASSTEHTSTAYNDPEVLSTKLIVAVGTTRVYVRLASEDMSLDSEQLTSTIIEPSVTIDNETVPILPLLHDLSSPTTLASTPEYIIAQFFLEIQHKYDDVYDLIIVYPANYSTFQVRRLKIAAKFAGLGNTTTIPISVLGALSCLKSGSSTASEVLTVHCSRTDFLVNVFHMSEDHIQVLASTGRKDLHFPGRFMTTHGAVIAASQDGLRKPSRHYDEIFLKALAEAGTHVGRIDNVCAIFEDDLLHLEETVRETLSYHQLTSTTESEVLRYIDLLDNFNFEDITEKFEVFLSGVSIAEIQIPRNGVVTDGKLPFTSVTLHRVNLGINEVIVSSKSDKEVYHFDLTAEHAMPLNLELKPVRTLMYNIAIQDANEVRIPTKNVSFPDLEKVSVMSMSKQTYL